MAITHSDTTSAGLTLADYLEVQGRLEEAETILQELFDGWSASSAQSPKLARITKRFGDICREQQKFAEATKYYLLLQDSFHKLDDKELADLLEHMESGLKYWEKRNRVDQAFPLRKLACDVSTRISGDSYQTAHQLSRLAVCYAAREEWQQVYELRMKELAIRRLPNIQNYEPRFCEYLVAVSLWRLERRDDAVKMLRKTLTSWQTTKNDPKRLDAHRLLATILAEQDKPEEAVQVLIAGIESLPAPKFRPRVDLAIKELISLYQTLGDETAADEWLSRVLRKD